MDLTSEDFRQRAARPWAAPIIAALRARVATAIARGVRIPAASELAGWAHDFTCSRCAVRLRFDPDQPERFACPACGQVEADAVRREAWTYFHNHAQIRAAREACLIGALDGAASPAVAYARAVLLGYARRYLSWPVHGRHAGKGRLQAQCLDEATWMLPASETFQRLVALGALDQAERAEVVDGMFRPAIALLRPQVHLVHNIHVWMAAALTALSDLCGEAETIAFAERHVRHCVERGVLLDGSWYECSPHYHYYTLQALLAFVDAARRAGRPLDGLAEVRRMLRAPLPLLRPDRQFAVLNDGWPEHPLAGHAALYEQAEGLVGGVADILAECWRGRQRDALEAVEYGPETLPDAALALPALAECDGALVARRGGLMALVKATPYGGGHDHCDQPTLDLHLADGTLEAGDLGNPGYGNPLHQAWFKRTAAHNTVLVDGADHAPARCRVLECAPRGPVDVLRVRVERALPDDGVILRTVVVGDGWVVDRCVVELAAAHDVLWRCHARAAFACDATATPAELLPLATLTRQRRLRPAGATLDGMWTSVRGGRLAVRVFAPSGADPAFGAATGPALPATDSVDLVCAGARGTRVAFLACFAVGALPALAGGNGPDGCTLRVAGHALRFLADGSLER